VGDLSTRPPLTHHPPASVEVPEPSTPQESSEDFKDGRDALGAQQCLKRPTGRQSPPAGSIDQRNNKRRREEILTSSDGELSFSERDFSDSDQGGHDNRHPKRRVSTNDFGASIWTLEEWRMLLTSGDTSDSKDLSEDDGKPQIHTDPSKSKTQWSAAEAQRTITRSLRILQGRSKEAPFRALKLPESIN
jgi:hypothetical protein